MKKGLSEFKWTKEKQNALQFYEVPKHTQIVCVLMIIVCNAVTGCEQWHCQCWHCVDRETVIMEVVYCLFRKVLIGIVSWALHV